MTSHVILAGFMGTGKTTVGRRLAARLGRPFIDTDALVEASAGRSVADIFAAEGEARFREREREAIARACAGVPAVIAIGGGALGDEANRRRLLGAGPVVCLEAQPEDILRRVGDADSRPMLAVDETDPAAVRAARLDRIRSLLAARAPVYAAATHHLDTTGLSVDEVADRVCELVGAR